MPYAAVWDTTRHVASAFCVGIAVSMMVMPMACTVMRQVFSQTPQGAKEAALALGATRWGIVTSVVPPFGRGGIIVIVEHGDTPTMFQNPRDRRTADYVNGRFG